MMRKTAKKTLFLIIFILSLLTAICFSGTGASFVTVVGSDHRDANRQLSKITANQNLIILSRSSSKSKIGKDGGELVTITAKVRHRFDR